MSNLLNEMIDDMITDHEKHYVAKLQTEINELRSQIELIKSLHGDAWADIESLFNQQPQNMSDGSYLVDGQSCFELGKAIHLLPKQCLASANAQAITDAIFNSEQIDIDGHKYVGLEDLQVNINQLLEQ